LLSPLSRPLSMSRLCSSPIGQLVVARTPPTDVSRTSTDASIERNPFIHDNMSTIEDTGKPLPTTGDVSTTESTPDANGTGNETPGVLKALASLSIGKSESESNKDIEAGKSDATHDASKSDEASVSPTHLHLSSNHADNCTAGRADGRKKGHKFGFSCFEPGHRFYKCIVGDFGSVFASHRCFSPSTGAIFPTAARHALRPSGPARSPFDRCAGEPARPSLCD
jgi:hypothetical protein